MLAGHPQLSVYSMVCYSHLCTVERRDRSIRPIWAGMIVGVGCSAFALVPMAMLIGRSTRLLALAPAANDVAMPYGRLAAFFLPWRDGVPPLLDNNPASAFRGYANLAYFGIRFATSALSRGSPYHFCYFLSCETNQQ
jgi:hypothetical protein